MSEQSFGHNTAIFNTKILQGVLVCFLFLVGFCLSADPTSAQVLYGALTGNVTDPSGAVVPGAQVEALSTTTGVSRLATSDSAGDYRFVELLPGLYKVRVTATSFGVLVA